MTTQPLDRAEEIDTKLATMVQALRYIASHDCDLAPDGGPCPPTDNPCSSCSARRALSVSNDWRYVGNRPERLHGNSPTARRERDIVAPWKHYMTSIATNPPDIKLAEILGFPGVTVHDWFVCTTLVQWLATNVGMCVLDEAGFKYQWDKSAHDANISVHEGNLHVKVGHDPRVENTIPIVSLYVRGHHFTIECKDIAQRAQVAKEVASGLGVVVNSK